MNPCECHSFHLVMETIGFTIAGCLILYLLRHRLESWLRGEEAKVGKKLEGK